MVQNDSEKSWMEPLLQMRNELTVKDYDKRDFRRLKGNVQLMGTEQDKTVPGPYLKSSREEWLRKLLQAQNKMRRNKQLPEDLKKLQLITQAELDQIRKIWFYDKLETDDVLPSICEEEAKGEYSFEPLEDSHVFDRDVLNILKETCGSDEMIFEIARSLLEVERKHFKSNRRTGLFDEFANIFKKSFYKDRTDAIEYAQEKKKIKDQSSKQLNLANNS